MQELVFVQNDEVVTDSLTVANVFEKQHKDVMRDIRSLDCSIEFWQRNFAPSDYEARGKRYPMYYITQDGFSFLAMGYTGKKAAEFKEKYINEFRMMEKQLNQPKVLSEREQLIASMKLSMETSEELNALNTKVSKLEDRFDNQLTLEHGQSVSLNHAVKKRIERLYEDGLMGSLTTKQQMYSNIYSQMKRAFQAPTYREVKRKDFNEALSWVESWRPI